MLLRSLIKVAITWVHSKKIGLPPRCYIGIIGFILGLYRDSGKENGNYRDYM